MEHGRPRPRSTYRVNLRSKGAQASTCPAKSATSKLTVPSLSRLCLSAARGTDPCNTKGPPSPRVAHGCSAVQGLDEVAVTYVSRVEMDGQRTSLGHCNDAVTEGRNVSDVQDEVFQEAVPSPWRGLGFSDRLF